MLHSNSFPFIALFFISLDVFIEPIKKKKEIKIKPTSTQHFGFPAVLHRAYQTASKEFDLLVMVRVEGVVRVGKDFSGHHIKNEEETSTKKTPVCEGHLW